MAINNAEFNRKAEELLRHFEEKQRAAEAEKVRAEAATAKFEEARKRELEENAIKNAIRPVHIIDFGDDALGAEIRADLAAYAKRQTERILAQQAEEAAARARRKSAHVRSLAQAAGIAA